MAIFVVAQDYAIVPAATSLGTKYKFKVSGDSLGSRELTKALRKEGFRALLGNLDCLVSSTKILH